MRTLSVIELEMIMGGCIDPNPVPKPLDDLLNSDKPVSEKPQFPDWKESVNCH